MTWGTRVSARIQHAVSRAGCCLLVLRALSRTVRARARGCSGLTAQVTSPCGEAVDHLSRDGSPTAWRIEARGGRSARMPTSLASRILDSDIFFGSEPARDHSAVVCACAATRRIRSMRAADGVTLPDM